MLILNSRIRIAKRTLRNETQPLSKGRDWPIHSGEGKI
jgi:hypothetical protein